MGDAGGHAHNCLQMGWAHDRMSGRRRLGAVKDQVLQSGELLPGPLSVALRVWEMRHIASGTPLPGGPWCPAPLPHTLLGFQSTTRSDGHKAAAHNGGCNRGGRPLFDRRLSALYLVAPRGPLRGARVGEREGGLAAPALTAFVADVQPGAGVCRHWSPDVHEAGRGAHRVTSAVISR